MADIMYIFSISLLLLKSYYICICKCTYLYVDECKNQKRITFQEIYNTFEGKIILLEMRGNLSYASEWMPDSKGLNFVQRLEIKRII